jgi:MYXO-CTERM domain-containing protein
MKVKTLSALAGLGGALILSGTADAAYLGVGAQLHTTVTISGAQRSVWRVYAVFSNPDDYLTSVAGSGELGPLTIQSLNAAGTAPGSNFYQNAFGGETAPNAEVVKKSPNAAWDTFATIGVAVDDGTDATGLSPGFPTFISGNQLGPNSNIAWFTKGAQPQGRAGAGTVGAFINNYAATPLVGMGVLLAQLTVNAGGNVAGTFAVGVDLAGGVAGGQSIANQSFTTAPIPAPGAIALLGLAGLVGSRRRRA